MSPMEREKAREEERREVEERRRRREERMGVERRGFGKGGWEREVLERELGNEPGVDADGRDREPKIGRNRKLVQPSKKR